MGMTPMLEQHLDDRDINHHVVVDLGAGAFNPLLMRMQALQLEPDEVMRIEADVFGYLAEACANCTSKEICARDLAVNRRGTLTRDRRAILTPPLCASSAAQGRSCGA
jgi:hypothetical protein